MKLNIMTKNQKYNDKKMTKKKTQCNEIMRKQNNESKKNLFIGNEMSIKHLLNNTKPKSNTQTIIINMTNNKCMMFIDYKCILHKLI